MSLTLDLGIYDATDHNTVLPNPYLDAGFDGIQDEEYAGVDQPSPAIMPVGFLARAQQLIAPKDTEEAAAFLRSAHNGPLEWDHMCLSLQRRARGLPAVFPSAASAAAATPESDRVYDLDKAERGMVGYSDDPNDSNAFGHIYFVAGRDKSGALICWTNDAKRVGGVDIVRVDYFTKHWGDAFQFCATSLNGYDFADFNQPAKPKRGRAKLGDNVQHAIDDLTAAIKHHRKKGHDKLVAALVKDQERMQRQMKRWN